MKTNKIISILLIVAIIMTIVISSIYKVYKNHREDLLKVLNQRIEEAGEKCILEGTCTEQQFTLETLIQNGYLESQIHPITKEYVDTSSSITCENYNCISSIN